MSLIDFILNLAGLLLWLNWRSVRLDPLARATPATLTGTLRRAVPNRLQRWHFLAALAALLLVRALFYWKIGGAVNWTARLNLGATSIPFQSDFFRRMLLFSVLSFALTLAIFYLWLLFFAVVNRNINDPLQKLVRLMLGRASRWPNWILLSLPVAGAVLVWLLISPLLARMSLVPAASFLHRIEQAVLLGLTAFLTWKYLIGAVLALYLVNSYIYLGKHQFWNFINLTSRQMLRPLRRLPLEIGKADFTPVVGITLVFLLAHFAENGVEIFRVLKIDGLIGLYSRLTP
ncbi:MAG TPA: hypothetical protein VIJ24_03365 [Verrucomicrobiae bacterium]|jgi:uncharacterized protein YggT (Ycf19 family)